MGKRFSPAHRPWAGKGDLTPEQLKKRWERLTPAEQRREERRATRYYAEAFARLGDPRLWPELNVKLTARAGKTPDPDKLQKLYAAYDDWRNDLPNIPRPKGQVT